MILKTTALILIGASAAHANGGDLCAISLGEVMASSGESAPQASRKTAAKGTTEAENSVALAAERAQKKFESEKEEVQKFVQKTKAMGERTLEKFSEYKELIEDAIDRSLFDVKDLEASAFFRAQFKNYYPEPAKGEVLLVGNEMFVVGEKSIRPIEALAGKYETVYLEGTNRELVLSDKFTEMYAEDVDYSRVMEPRNIEELQEVLDVEILQTQEKQAQGVNSLFKDKIQKKTQLELTEKQERSLRKALREDVIDYDFLNEAKLIYLVKRAIGFTAQRTAYEVFSNPKQGDLILGPEGFIFMPIEAVPQTESLGLAASANFLGFELGVYTYEGKVGGFEIVQNTTLPQE